MQKNVKDQKLIDHFTLLVAGLDTSKMGQDELMDFILDISRNNPGDQGASYSSDNDEAWWISTIGVVMVLGMVVLFILIGYSIYTCSRDGDCGGGKEGDDGGYYDDDDPYYGTHDNNDNNGPNHDNYHCHWNWWPSWWDVLGMGDGTYCHSH